MSILHPLTPRLTTRHTLLVVLIIWLLSLLICTPDVALINFSHTKNGPQCYVGKARRKLNCPHNCKNYVPLLGDFPPNPLLGH